MFLFDINYLNEHNNKYTMTNNFTIQTPQFEWQEINLKGNKSYFISGYISTIDADDYNEVVTMQAQEKLLQACQDRMKTEAFITMDVEHEEFLESDRVLRKPKNTRIPVAKIVDAELREKGVWVKAEINRHGDRFKEVWNSIKEGYLHSFSIAFAPLKKVTQRINGVVQTLIEDLNLTNVTLTGSPVNQNATFTVTLKAKLQEEENNMTDEKVQEPVAEEVAPEVVDEKPVEKEEKPATEEEKPLTVNELVDNVRALEKERAQFEADKKEFEAQRVEFTESSKPAEEVKPSDLVAQIKSENDTLKAENAELKSKLNAPILKSKINTAADRTKEFETKKSNPMDRI